MIEKYAVDNSDDVENKAEELIKTGKAKDLSSAREEAMKFSDGGSNE